MSRKEHKTQTPSIIQIARKSVHKAIPPRDYIGALLIILFIMAIPPAVFSKFNSDIFFTKYSLWFFVYFAIVATIGYAIMLTRIKKTHIDPIDKLSEAMQKVAKGDFSVRLSYDKHSKSFVVVHMYEDFNTMVAELASLDATKDDFIATVSHEIKTPLAVINNYSKELAKANLSRDDQQLYAETIVAATERLSALVANILRLNKIENKKILATKLCYNLSRQLSDCALQFEDIWEKKNINFEFDIDDKLMIVADSQTMEIVWNNLLSNAFKYTNPGGTVRVYSEAANDKIKISISDTGCGIAPEDIKHIFEKFYQANSSHSPEGNGLGLALVKKIIELNGFLISVQSEPDCGSCFTVTI